MKNKAIKLIDSNYILTFGKYEGETVRDMMWKNPSYLLWAHNNVKGFTLNDTLYGQLRDKLSNLYSSDIPDGLDWRDLI